MVINPKPIALTWIGGALLGDIIIAAGLCDIMYARVISGLRSGGPKYSCSFLSPWLGCSVIAATVYALIKAATGKI